jgi:hypothetical protein
MVLARSNIRKVATPGALTKDLKVACADYYTDTSKCLNIHASDVCEPVCKYRMVHELEDKAEMYLIKDHDACKFASLMTGLGASILEPARALCVAFDDHCEKKKKKKVKVIVKPHKIPDDKDFDACQETCCGKQAMAYEKQLKLVGCETDDFHHQYIVSREYPMCKDVFKVVSNCIIKVGEITASAALTVSAHQAWSKLLSRSKDLCIFGIRNYIHYLGLSIPSFHIAFAFPESICQCFDNRCDTK